MPRGMLPQNIQLLPEPAQQRMNLLNQQSRRRQREMSLLRTLPPEILAKIYDQPPPPAPIADPRQPIADPNIATRGNLLPIGRTQSGEMTLAVPQMGLDLLRSAQLPGAVAQDYNPTFEDVARMSADTMMGGMGVSGALGGVGPGALGATVWHGSPHKWLPGNKIGGVVRRATFSGPDKARKTFRSDIPNEDWLASKVEYSKSKGTNEFGAPHFETVTGNFDGAIEMPVSELKNLKGLRGEQGRVRPDDLDGLVKHMGETGKLPSMQNGKEYAPFVMVDYRGVPWVSEGNHRIMAADKLGWKSMPVEVRYFDGGERLAKGVFAPQYGMDLLK